MKHPGTFLPEPPQPPPPPKFELLSVILSLTMMTISLGLALYCFRDAGIIGDELFVAATVFIVAISGGVIFATTIGRQARRDAQKRANEIPPPFDIYLVWPLDIDPESEDCTQRKNSSPPRRKGPRAQEKP